MTNQLTLSVTALNPHTGLSSLKKQTHYTGTFQTKSSLTFLLLTVSKWTSQIAAIHFHTGADWLIRFVCAVAGPGSGCSPSRSRPECAEIFLEAKALSFFFFVWCEKQVSVPPLPPPPSPLWRHGDGLYLSAQKHIVFFSTAGYSICRVSLWNIMHIYHWLGATGMQFQKGAFVRDRCSALLSAAHKWIQGEHLRSPSSWC